MFSQQEGGTMNSVFIEIIFYTLLLPDEVETFVPVL